MASCLSYLTKNEITRYTHAPPAYRLGRRSGSPLRCGFFKRHPRKTPQPACTSEYALVYCLSGEMTYRDATGTYHVEANSLLQRIPHRGHETLDCGEEAIFIAFLAIPGSIYQGLCQVEGLSQAARAVEKIGPQPWIPRTIEKLRERLANVEEQRLGTVLLRMQAFVLAVHKQITRTRMDPPTQELLDKACDLMRKNLEKRFPLEALTADLNISYSLFRKLFSKHIGISPGAWLLHRRIEKAQELLCDVTRPIKAVADRLGYPDVYTFSRQFKKLTGLSPGRFRSRTRL